MMRFRVEINQFDGPLDLMLHLVKENKLDLMDLDLDVLAEQYISFVSQVQESGLEVASEFLVEMASLIEYKSRKLLPRVDVEIEEEYEQTRQQLVNRLIEYQQFKEVTEDMAQFYVLRQQRYTRPYASLIDHWQNQEDMAPLAKHSVRLLNQAMRKVMQRQAILHPYETKLEVKEVSVQERNQQLLSRLSFHTRYTFEQLCEDCDSLHLVITTFLSVLDLIHQRLFHYELIDNKLLIERRNP